jgi:hypothetical protein
MRVSVIYEVAEVVCDLCGNYHVAVIPTDMIEWFDDSKEIKYVEDVECPVCNKMTKVKR